MSESGIAAQKPLLRFDLFTLFPGIFAGPLDESILRRARDRGIVEIAIHDIRDWAVDRHRTVDDTTYGGGAGMVMMAPPIVSAVEETLASDLARTRILVMSAGGRLFNQPLAEELMASARIAIVCGRYEGIDYRAIEILEAEEISIGDYVLTGGELAASVVVDAVTRLVPGVIDAASVDRGIPPRTVARIPAVHAATRLPRAQGAPGSLEWAPRGDRALAPGAVPAPHCPPTPGPTGSRKPLSTGA